MKEFVLLTGCQETGNVLANQLEEIMGDYVACSHFSSEEGYPTTIMNQLVVLSHKLMEDEPDVKRCIGDGCKVIIAERIINYEHIDKLLFLPAGTNVLYMNDDYETCKESIESLKKLGIDHINYIPFYPGIQNSHKIEIAITPGKFMMIPDYVKEVVNIGTRLMDISTIIQILDYFHLNEPGNVISQRYMRKIIQLSQKLANTSQKANDLNKHLNEVLDGVNDGILTINKDGYVIVFNEELGYLFNVSPKRAIGRKISDIIEHPELITFLLDPSPEEDRWFTFNQIEAVVHRFPLNGHQSIVATFKNVRKTIEIEKKLRRELVMKGYVAKYTLGDIIGESSILRETKATAKKLAITDFSILIQGESGTGKELFASAIHNCSPREKGPFLAVNFSAISEDLVESELFGYEDGAFTGAKKGGKVGLFEQANGGTIFLDEIGDISLKLQARLLRVLQEKEIMRIGGSKIIPVDVRVIAATNKNLLKMIEQGKFREDLYHRLKVLFLRLPELRNRIDDIPHLIQHFIRQSGKINIKIMPEVVRRLCSFSWYGNVRELKNAIDYMLSVCEENTIQLNDIPSENSFQLRVYSPETVPQPMAISEKSLTPDDEEELILLLKALLSISEKGETPNRKKVTEMSQTWKKPLTEHQVRRRFDILELRGYIAKCRGRSGTKLTQLGLDTLMKI
ncbi:AAA family ATPase [Brevibacillus fluminis]|uniref:AAA family ATPase n=1 Tax=Brevibacillus fluminis TaxID=511487 RepID=A0A3M8DI43_9BACL|nr:sigma 54-interacting transcriptional regulator [Brevibacillus fluminis]RNB87686.1 AAA family ATPase [Brevibacillus fluminis]